MRIFYLTPEGKKRLAVLVVIALAIVALIFAARTIKIFEAASQTVGSRETILLKTPAGHIEVVAKIDTGADSTSIDEEYALSLGLKRSSIDRIVTSARGREKRDTIGLDFVLGNKNITTLATAADRDQLSTKMLIGKSDLADFIVDPNSEFLAPPIDLDGRTIFYSAADFLRHFLNRSVSQMLLLIPILGAVIVLLRIFAGLRTYGIFAPLIIALTLIDAGIIRGLGIYVGILLIGISAKVLFFSRLNLPHIAEMCLIMFTIVLALALGSAVFFKTDFISSDVFFPLIITSHLIERFTKSVEEHRIADALPLLAQTLGVSLAAAFLGLYLIGLSVNMLWLVFLFSVFGVVGASGYVGPRLSELVRFKF